VPSYGGLADSYRAVGKNEKAAEALEFYLDNVADDAAIRQELAYNYLFDEKYDLAQAEIDKAIAFDPGQFLNLISEALRATRTQSYLFWPQRIGLFILIAGKVRKIKRHAKARN